MKPGLNDCCAVILGKPQTGRRISTNMKAFLIDCFSLTTGQVCACAWVFTCMCLHLVSIQLQDGYWMHVCVCACVCAQPLVCICLMQSHTECFINPAKALINVINWRRLTHTPGSPALFLEPEGQWHNVHSYLESLGWNDGLKSFIPLEYCVSSLAADYLSSV